MSVRGYRHPPCRVCGMFVAPMPHGRIVTGLSTRKSRAGVKHVRMGAVLRLCPAYRGGRK